MTLDLSSRARLTQRALPLFQGGSLFHKVARVVSLLEGDVREVPLASTDVVVSVHACGALTDAILTRAMAASARVGVLPCCHDHASSDLGGLEGWLDPAPAIDVTRVARLRSAGYEVSTQRIPGAITEKNRLIVASPR